jgi:hypothetical protein
MHRFLSYFYKRIKLGSEVYKIVICVCILYDFSDFLCVILQRPVSIRVWPITRETSGKTTVSTSVSVSMPVEDSTGVPTGT